MHLIRLYFSPPRITAIEIGTTVGDKTVKGEIIQISGVKIKTVCAYILGAGKRLILKSRAQPYY